MRSTDRITTTVMVAMGVILVIGMLCAPVLALTKADRAPHTRFEEALAKVLGTDPITQTASYHLRHVSTTLYDSDNMRALLESLPPQKLNEIMAPLGYSTFSKPGVVVHGAPLGSMSTHGPAVALDPPRPADANAQRAMRELAKAIEADRLTDEAIAAEMVEAE